MYELLIHPFIYTRICVRWYLWSEWSNASWLQCILYAVPQSLISPIRYINFSRVKVLRAKALFVSTSDSVRNGTFQSTNSSTSLHWFFAKKIRNWTYVLYDEQFFNIYREIVLSHAEVLMICANELLLMSPLHANQLPSVDAWPSASFPLESDDGANCKRCQVTVIHVSLIVMVIVALFCRSNIAEAGSFGALFTLAVFSFTVALGIVCLKSITRLLATMCISKKSNIKQFFVASSHILNGYGNGIIAIALSSSSGFYLLARVTAGQCLDSDDIWKSQSCNPVALARSFPHDQVIICYLLPILIQLTVKGAKIEMAVLQWLIASTFVSICLVVVDGWLQIWTLIYSIFFLHISFEIEQFFVQIRKLSKDLQDSSRLVSDIFLNNSASH